MGFKKVKMSFMLKEQENITINNQNYLIIKQIGHGKGGYSFLASRDGMYVVIKKMHHEPCDYYQFGNKIEAEISDYQTLKNTGIRIPKIIDFDKEQEVIVKEYIEGKTAFDLVLEGKLEERHLAEIREIQAICKSANINIDYYPTNYIITDEGLYYIDYECNKYDAKWDFDNWGQQFWKTKPRIFETERLLMRPFRTDDAEPMFKNWANDPEVAKYVTWSPHGEIGVTEQLISMWVKQDSEPYFFQYVITEKGLDEPIGSLGVVRVVDKIPEIGYCLSRSRWGKGYMTEACMGLMNVLFGLGFDEIHIEAIKENKRSLRVVEKCGFSYIGERKIKDKDGGDATVLMFSLKKKEFETRKG